MRPKKAKELIPAVARKQNLPEKAVEDIVNFYWREVWTSMTNAEGIKVHLTNLGDFNIKHWLLDKEIQKLENFGNVTRLKGTQRYAAGIKVSDKLSILNNLKVLISEEQQRKEFIYEHKRTINENKKEESDSDMEEQGTDTGGHSQYSIPVPGCGGSSQAPYDHMQNLSSI